MSDLHGGPTPDPVNDDGVDDVRDDTRDAAPAETARDAAPRRVDRFRSTATGSALAAMMSGLGDVLEPSKKEIAPIVWEHDDAGEPFEDPIVLRLDPDDPRDSIVLVRRHLQK